MSAGRGEEEDAARAHLPSLPPSCLPSSARIVLRPRASRVSKLLQRRHSPSSPPLLISHSHFPAQLNSLFPVRNGVQTFLPTPPLCWRFRFTRPLPSNELLCPRVLPLPFREEGIDRRDATGPPPSLRPSSFASRLATDASPPSPYAVLSSSFVTSKATRLRR